MNSLRRTISPAKSSRHEPGSLTVVLAADVLAVAVATANAQPAVTPVPVA